MAIAGSRAGGYGRPQKLAKFKCTSCGHHYEEKPGGTICPKCGHKYVTWVNADEFVKVVAEQDAELERQARAAADDAMNKAKAAVAKVKKDKRKRKSSAKQRKRK